jgi:hypothetical protein
MSLWLIMLILMSIKLPLAALMLWLPFRGDDAIAPAKAADPADGDGGSPALPAGQLNPHPRPTSPRPFPRLPRRGPHGGPPPPSPRRVRTDAVGTRRVRVSRTR